jgi:hypothetical protein
MPRLPEKKLAVFVRRKSCVVARSCCCVSHDSFSFVVLGHLFWISEMCEAGI